jgi:CRISPR-associated endonuclease/helicase Cas3
VATRGTRPYPYQSGLAEHGLPDVLRVPTRTGKTLAATPPWLYRRLEHPDPVVRQTTPHWLVVVLPQRALVEQTVWVIEGWLRNLRLGIPVHVLMGGEDTGDHDWKTHPEPERIFVGTLDMVLSRLLMRGFAEGRSTWPMSFGLLHAGVQFVFDEVQLMGPGLPTSLQLQGLREELGTAVPCRSMWMSATLDPTELRTVDFRRERSVVELGDDDRDGPLRIPLMAPRTVRRLNLGDVEGRRYPRTLAERVTAEHRPGTRTLVVLNTVERATALFDELAGCSGPFRQQLCPTRPLNSRTPRVCWQGWRARL